MSREEFDEPSPEVLTDMAIICACLLFQKGEGAEKMGFPLCTNDPETAETFRSVVAEMLERIKGDTPFGRMSSEDAAILITQAKARLLKSGYEMELERLH